MEWSDLYDANVDQFWGLDGENKEYENWGMLKTLSRGWICQDIDLRNEMLQLERVLLRGRG